jgi:hypothetical protein
MQTSLLRVLPIIFFNYDLLELDAALADALG